MTLLSEFLATSGGEVSRRVGGHLAISENLVPLVTRLSCWQSFFAHVQIILQELNNTYC